MTGLNLNPNNVEEQPEQPKNNSGEDPRKEPDYSQLENYIAELILTITTASTGVARNVAKLQVTEFEKTEEPATVADRIRSHFKTQNKVIPQRHANALRHALRSLWVGALTFSRS